MRERTRDDARGLCSPRFQVVLMDRDRRFPSLMCVRSRRWSPEILLANLAEFELVPNKLRPSSNRCSVR